MLILLWLVACGVAGAQTKPVRRILILNELGYSYPAIRIIDQGIRSALENSPYQLDFYTEHLDTIQFPDPATQQKFRDFYLQKYQDRRPDVIITVGPSPLKFMMDVHKKVFAGVPIIFCLPNQAAPGSPALDPDFTGVENDIAAAETVEAILRLRPSTKQVVVVGGQSAYDKQQQTVVKEQLKPYSDRVSISFLTNLAIPDLLERLRHLPENAAVLLTTIGEDAAGRHLPSSETGPMVVGASSVPVYSMFDVYIGHGEVGGYLSSLGEQGKVAGRMALNVLAGAQPESIPIVKGVSVYMFDSRAMKRWGLKESNLPAGSIVLNRERTIWEAYRWYIIGGTSLILWESLLVGALLWQRSRRRKAEVQQARALETARESEERFRLVANTAPVMIWMSDADKQWTYLNQTWLEFTGRVLQQELGNGWMDGVRTEDKQSCLQTYARAYERHEPFRMEYRLRRYDGEYRWIFDYGVPRFDADGSFAGYIGSCLDVTERKQAEEALSSVSRRLIEAHEEERTWIARELHDDINQRIALLTVNLENLGSGFQFRENRQVEELREYVTNLGSDIQALSHRLHSSKLDYLGLEAAASSLCKEISQGKNVEIDFESENVPKTVPKEVSLCLFRVLQEALQNAIKYSGTGQFKVSLKGAGDEIHLSVHDFGVGFDPEKAMTGGGLGLTSMKERLILVGGQLCIESQRRLGTTILARVPLRAKMKSAAAVA
jgi:PAS domain S-box-containing protein